MLNSKSFAACEIPDVKLAKKNSTSKVAHETAVKYSCEIYHKAEGETIRKCVNGKVEPSFQLNPLACTSKLILISKQSIKLVLKLALNINFNRQYSNNVTGTCIYFNLKYQRSTNILKQTKQ